MSSLVSIADWICVVGHALEAALILRLTQIGCYRRGRLPLFLLFLICDFSRDMLLRLDTTDWFVPHYSPIWALTAPLIWALLIAAVFELFGRIHRLFPGEKQGDRLLRIAVAVASGISLLVALVMMANRPGGIIDTPEEVILFGSRTILLATTLVLWFQAAYLALTHAELPRNLRVHRMAFAIFLTAGALERLVGAISDAQQLTTVLDLVASVTWTSAICIWLFGLRQIDILPDDPAPLSGVELAAIDENYRRHVTDVLEAG